MATSFLPEVVDLLEGGQQNSFHESVCMELVQGVG